MVKMFWVFGIKFTYVSTPIKSKRLYLEIGKMRRIPSVLLDKEGQPRKDRFYYTSYFRISFGMQRGTFVRELNFTRRWDSGEATTPLPPNKPLTFSRLLHFIYN